ncbi:MAG: bifunctional oligoribonuclease/PAP phosphatase NrnA [Spirochaetales bacterium]|nr:bifunctional oligoribonuclease/PAP phosphatase NrnA [Spirochaetales bacterium]
MFEKALELIKQHDTIIIHRHKNPDGDALGSQVGLYHMIRDTFPSKTVHMVGEGSRRYDFIADTPMSELPDSAWAGALAIILDTSAKSLISDDRYQLAAMTLRIDHHIQGEKVADFEIDDTGYESCAGLVTEMAIETGMVMSDKAATALFAGTVTDSGRFRFDCTTSGTFRRVSFLLQRNVNMDSVYKKLYTTDIASLKLKAHFIQKARFTEHNVGWLYTDKAELKELGISAFTASRGYVNTLSDLEGVNIWVAFAEADEGILCELRSAEPNINPIAVKYGGGGHAKASGATVKDRETAMAMLKDLDELASESQSLQD